MGAHKTPARRFSSQFMGQTMSAGPPQGLAANIQGKEDIMSQKAHGTCENAPRTEADGRMRWGADTKTADKICCFNRHYAEHSGYWEAFLQKIADTRAGPDMSVTFYDSITGKPAFVAPRGRTWEAFVRESQAHGWPSFRDAEVVQENVRVLSNGEAVSPAGTHLGHNLPDSSGNRYCINLVSVAAPPPVKSDL